MSALLRCLDEFRCGDVLEASRDFGIGVLLRVCDGRDKPGEQQDRDWFE
jgi:hypothetical protein